ncbi:MAG: isoprenylcysteine carboxylmethyltransferase family protein [Alphaproteobacteria bacterium]|nr:isoprenylcysteine carboxylmethyltransferase family protein [Alphaproteobacteria bacterium]
MDFVHDWLLWGLWIAWLAYWIWAASGTKKTRRVESLSIAISHWTPLVIGIVLISLPQSGRWGWLTARLLPFSEPLFWISVAGTVAGLGFAVWARLYLGSNWSGVVTLKDDHTLIRGGPYGLVRHPIYTGILLALVGSALVRGDAGGVSGLLLIAGAFLRKIGVEERWLAEQFPGDYAAYRRDVPALIPRLLPR